MHFLTNSRPVRPTAKKTFKYKGKLDTQATHEGIAIDGNGNIYLSSVVHDKFYLSDRVIRVIDKHCRFLRQFSIPLQNLNQLGFDASGHLMAVDSFNTVFVTVMGTIVKRLASNQFRETDPSDPIEKMLLSFQTHSILIPGQWYGVVVDRDGNYVVSDSTQKIRIITPEGVSKKVFYLRETYSRDNTLSIAFDVLKNHLIVCDKRDEKIYRVDPHVGRVITTYGSKDPFSDPTTGRTVPPSRLPNTFCYPTSILVDGEGNLIVLDAGNHRVQLLSGDGAFFAQFGEQGEQQQLSSAQSINQLETEKLFLPKSIALTADGDILINDATGRLLVFG